MDQARLIRVKTLIDSAIIAQREQDTKLQQLKQDLETAKSNAQLYKDTANYLVDLLKKIKQHEDDKKIAAYSLIEDSLKQIGSIIPSSQMSNVGLFVENGKAYIINKSTGQPLSLTEGGAVNSIACLIMRYLVVVNNVDFCNFLYIDEGLSTVGHSNIDALKDLINKLAKNCLIIITEQKHDVTEGIANVVFRFEKPSDDEPTRITKEVIVEEDSTGL